MKKIALFVLIAAGCCAQEAASPSPTIAPKAGVAQVDKRLQNLFEKIRRLQGERETLEALIVEKDEQLETLQDQVIALLKERDFYEQQLGEPENPEESPYQP